MRAGSGLLGWGMGGCVMRCHWQGTDWSDISTNKPCDASLNPSRVTALPGLPIKGSLFHSVGSQTLFTLSPQENFPVGSRRIYGLINLFFKKAHVLQLVGSGEAEPSSPGCPLLGAGEGYARTLHPGRLAVLPGGEG